MEWVDNHILTLVTFLPLVGALLLLFSPLKGKALIHAGALIAVVEFVLSLHLYFHFGNTGTFEFVEATPWIEVFKINYLMGIDGVSLLLILLTTVLTPLVLWGSLTAIQNNIKMFVVSLLILESGMVGVFCALDLILFYVFWEVMLIPMYFIIGIWGGTERIYASIKFFLYTMAGSVLMLLAILYLYFDAGQTFSLLELYEHRLATSPQLWVFAAFALAFAIKVPLFPLHTWLPDAHVQAPTAGSVILAGVLLKMGTYGFFRFAMPLFPEALQIMQPWLIAFSVIGIIYGALVAMVQTDIKKLIAYSSVSHLGVVMLGLFALEKTAIQGGLYQMISHGISTGALFMLVGIMYERTHSREIALHGGLAGKAPYYTVLFLVASFSSMGLPLTNGFVGEFLSFTGTFQGHPWAAVLAASGVVLSAIYLLWMIERVFFGELKLPPHAHVHDINLREVLVMIPFMILIFWMGIYPKPFLSKLDRPVEQLLIQMELTSDMARNQP